MWCHVPVISAVSPCRTIHVVFLYANGSHCVPDSWSRGPDFFNLFIYFILFYLALWSLSEPQRAAVPAVLLSWLFKGRFQHGNVRRVKQKQLHSHVLICISEPWMAAD